MRMTYELQMHAMGTIFIVEPNVNLKFYRDLTADRWNEQLAAPSLLDLGCCSLHIIYSAFKTCVNATGWKMDLLLRSLTVLCIF